MVRRYTQALTPEDYLNQRLDKSGDCWIFTFSKDKDGYGQVHCAATAKQLGVTRAHQMAYATWVGPIPKGMLVCHKCDNPPCCNPDHLFIGTVGDNTRDMVAKGRQPKNIHKIKADYKEVCKHYGRKTCHEVGREYGISYSRVCQIWRQAGLKQGNKKENKFKIG